MPYVRTAAYAIRHGRRSKGRVSAYRQTPPMVACTANSEKLATLQRGMSYQETARVMRCPGKMLSTSDSHSRGISVVEWDGPGPGPSRPHKSNSSMTSSSTTRCDREVASKEAWSS